MVYKSNILLIKKPGQQLMGMERLLVMLGDSDRVGIACCWCTAPFDAQGLSGGIAVPQAGAARGLQHPHLGLGG